MEGAGPRERRPSGGRDRAGVRGRRAAAGGGPAGSRVPPETCCFLEVVPAQPVRPSLVPGALPVLGRVTGLPLDKQLKLSSVRHMPGVMSPLHYLAIRYSRQPHSLKAQGEWEDDERRRRRREKNKVAAARCRNKKRERTEFLQKESERLELMNGELKSQIEELKRERQELMHLLNRHRPTCIVRTDSVRSPDPVLLQ